MTELMCRWDCVTHRGGVKEETEDVGAVVEWLILSDDK